MQNKIYIDKHSLRRLLSASSFTYDDLTYNDNYPTLLFSENINMSKDNDDDTFSINFSSEELEGEDNLRSVVSDILVEKEGDELSIAKQSVSLLCSFGYPYHAVIVGVPSEYVKEAYILSLPFASFIMIIR